MGLKGEDTYWQSGISACTVCDGVVLIFQAEATCCDRRRCGRGSNLPDEIRVTCLPSCEAPWRLNALATATYSTASKLTMLKLAERTSREWTVLCHWSRASNRSHPIAAVHQCGWVHHHCPGNDTDLHDSHPACIRPMRSPHTFTCDPSANHHAIPPVVKPVGAKSIEEQNPGRTNTNVPTNYDMTDRPPVRGGVGYDIAPKVG